MLVALLVAVAVVCVQGETYDVVQPHKLSGCPLGCARWADVASDGSNVTQAKVDALWRDKQKQKDAGRSCAQPALSPFQDASVIGGYGGAYCFCAHAGGNVSEAAYCVSAAGVPEQINLQVSAPDVVVASFVTFGALPDGAVPVAQVARDEKFTQDVRNYTGVTHTYLSPSSDGGTPQPVRSYNMHFVALVGLAERTEYYYRVAPGHGVGKFSDVFSFRSLYTSGVTKIAIFGDMGMMSDGNTNHANMLRDGIAGDIDAFVHMGDHAYQMSSDDDRRGDGYMNAYQPLTTKVPWLPVIGNHEFYDNAYFHRFLNQSYGVQLGRGAVSSGQCSRSNCASDDEVATRHPTANPEEKITADSALGTLLARTQMVALNSRTSGPVPSNTSRWYSTEIGLMHLIALDMMVYPGSTPDPGPEPGVYRKAQHDWLKEDLKAINRTKTPWVIAFAHHPLYCSSITMGLGTVEFGEDPMPMETANLSLTPFQAAKIPPGKHYKGCTGTGEAFVTEARLSLEPLFLKHGVDLFIAGHEHNYESMWPVKHCTIGSLRCYIGDSFDKPQAPVHIVCGEGGTGGGDKFGDNWGMFTRKELGEDTFGNCSLSSGGPNIQGGCSAGYGRMVAHNATHLTYQYVLNTNGTVWDEFTIYQPNHGRFE